MRRAFVAIAAVVCGLTLWVTGAGAGQGMRWWQSKLDYSFATCQQRAKQSLVDAGYPKPEQHGRVWFASDTRPISVSLICYGFGDQSIAFLVVAIGTDEAGQYQGGLGREISREIIKELLAP